MSFSRIYPLSSRNWWDTWDYPSRLDDQHFGMPLLEKDLMPSIFHRGFQLRPRTRANIDSSGSSEVKNESDKFKVMLNINHFTPEEISVKMVDNYIIVHGKHEEKTDEHGFVSREFTRRYMLAEGIETDKLVSKLTRDGLLTIEAPKKPIEPAKSNERVVPITIEKPAVEGEGK